ncbi:hypothetical protein [Ferviditalea candida]|uniref:HD domain-containing protein n=1 Tax=Ferviditalea candida TaxID=3108399 RepID=A0ABU5ZK06_9BACL|nr:hypothetical protein [Paenibacillaceae bacterium T2]
MRQSVGRLLAESWQRPHLLPVPFSTTASETKEYAHAVNVAIMSLRIGKYLGYTGLQLRELAIGCMLHDKAREKE